MDKFLDFLTKAFEVVLNRKLMALIGGIAALLFLVYHYLVPAELVIAGVLKYSLVFGCAGAFGLLVHWGFDADSLIKKRTEKKATAKAKQRKCEELEKQIGGLGADQIAILLRFAESGESSEYFRSYLINTGKLIWSREIASSALQKGPYPLAFQKSEPRRFLLGVSFHPFMR